MVGKQRLSLLQEANHKSVLHNLTLLVLVSKILSSLCSNSSRSVYNFACIQLCIVAPHQSHAELAQKNHITPTFPKDPWECFFFRLTWSLHVITTQLDGCITRIQCTHLHLSHHFYLFTYLPSLLPTYLPNTYITSTTNKNNSNTNIAFN